MIYRGVNNGFQGGKLIRFAKNSLSQKPSVQGAIRCLQIGAKLGKYGFFLGFQRLIAQFINIENG
jgi:hypothetical protein